MVCTLPLTLLMPHGQSVSHHFKCVKHPFHLRDFSSNPILEERAAFTQTYLNISLFKEVIKF
jgi:hypothetical protein